MPLETSVEVVRALAERGYNADREAVTLLADADDSAAAIDRAVAAASNAGTTLRADDVRAALEANPAPAEATDPSISGGAEAVESPGSGGSPPDETMGLAGMQIARDMTGWSTGTGSYGDFLSVFRDRYERIAAMLRGRVNHRPADAIQSMAPGSEAAIIGMVADIRSTAGGHWLIELEDTTGTFPCLVLSDRDIADAVQDLMLDEVIAVEGTLADDAGVLFADTLYHPDIPRTHEPSTADRHVRAALISDIHVGSQEFLDDAWRRFADWLHSDEAAAVEYLLIAGDMVEGVGVYPDQDEELDIVDVYDQYAAFSERLKEVPGDLEIVMIPGNHDAVRLAEPQPAFDQELRETMAAHDARFASNPSVVDIEGVSILMYHGVSLDEVIAELPSDAASYESPEAAMAQLLRKRHLAPQFGGHTRLAPESEDHLVIESVPDVFHAGHVHKLGYGQYHGVLTINSGCWQGQTAFQESVNLDPDPGYAPIVDLDTLELTIRKFV
ncbi:MAG: DNA-directed DNA polymerase II small subunit [Salinirussus sp.]